MLRNVYQSGILTLFNSAGTHPLQLWSTSMASDSDDCLINIAADDDQVECLVLTIKGTDIRSVFISCPSQMSETLGIRLPFVCMILKNIELPLSFEIETIDDHGVIRRFRASNYETRARVHHEISVIPLQLDKGWNHLTFDLEDMTRRIYGRKHCETRRITFHANACLRLVLFSDRIVPEEHLSDGLRLVGRPETTD
ncbi:hypothetical protein GGF40_003413 [Coemansia sp. RSA 1286]|nr:hypothetical protein GGF40_003413 [Coemansia sp. RSA 1286]